MAPAVSKKAKKNASESINSRLALVIKSGESLVEGIFCALGRAQDVVEGRRVLGRAPCTFPDITALELATNSPQIAQENTPSDSSRLSRP
jgi:hypothetical protein